MNIPSLNSNKTYHHIEISYMRSRYGLIILIIILSILVGGCATSKHSPKRSVRNKYKKERVIKKSHKEKIKVRNLTGIRKEIVEEALDWEGTPYRYAGYTKGEGTDCSGMVLSVYLDIAGIKLPRNSAKQAEFCKHINSSNVEPGDLVFFATGKDPSRVSHVGIMIDEDRFIHASTSKGVVISNVSAPYYQRTFKGFGRVLER